LRIRESFILDKFSKIFRPPLPKSAPVKSNVEGVAKLPRRSRSVEQPLVDVAKPRKELPKSVKTSNVVNAGENKSWM